MEARKKYYLCSHYYIECMDNSDKVAVNMQQKYCFMKHRVHRILLVCCSYDGYILEEDGHIETQINQEYIDLNMSNPPSLTRVSSTTEALDLLAEDSRFDFILTMYNVGEPDAFDFARIVKER